MFCLYSPLPVVIYILRISTVLCSELAYYNKSEAKCRLLQHYRVSKVITFLILLATFDRDYQSASARRA